MFDSKAEACCALAVLAIHYPDHIVEAIPTLANLLEAPAIAECGAAWALSTWRLMTTMTHSIQSKNHPEAHQVDQGRLDGRL